MRFTPPSPPPSYFTSPSSSIQSSNIFSMITRKIQEETLRTYLFTFSCVYDSMSLETLATTFELDVPSVHSTVSKMIISEELMVRSA